MTLFLIASSSEGRLEGSDSVPIAAIPEYALHARECALRFSGCEVAALSDMPGSGWYNYDYLIDDEWLPLWDGLAGAVKRWVIIEAYCRRHRVTTPIFSCDWDLLIFENLQTHFAKLKSNEYDFGHCVDRRYPEGLTSAPCLVNNHQCIKVYCQTVLAMCQLAHPCKRIQWADMSWWNRLREYADSWKVFNAGQETDDAILDPNINLDTDIYEDEDGRKKVVFVDKKPHFVRKQDRQHVNAVGVHCFMAYKERTGELMSQS